MPTQVSASLPDVTMQPGDTVTVTLDDASAIVTKLNVYALNLETGETVELPKFTPLFSYEGSVAAA